jgi:dienelactone hydrolase
MRKSKPGRDTVPQRGRIALACVAALLGCLATPVRADVRTVEARVDDGTGREVPLMLVARPGAARGVILFSHGALSSPAKNRAIIDRWAEEGFVVIAPLHADSTDWTGVKPAREQQIDWRLADMRLARAKLPELAAEAEASLDAAPVFAAGHSFGALIAMLDADPAIVAVIGFSPPGPLPGLPIPVVGRPLLTVTGTADTLPMIAPQWQAHLHGHDQAEGPALAYVAAGADHYFGGVFGRPELPGPRQQAQFDEAMQVAALFLAAYSPGGDGKPGKLLDFRPAQGELRVRNPPR